MNSLIQKPPMNLTLKQLLQKIKPLDQPLKDLPQSEREKYRYGEYDKKYMKKWRQQQKQKGLCRECTKPIYKSQHCKKHYHTQQKQSKKYRTKHQQKEPYNPQPKTHPQKKPTSTPLPKNKTEKNNKKPKTI